MTMSTPGSSKSISELQEPSEEEVYEVEKLMGHRMSLKYKVHDPSLFSSY